MPPVTSIWVKKFLMLPILNLSRGRCTEVKEGSCREAIGAGMGTRRFGGRGLRPNEPYDGAYGVDDGILAHGHDQAPLRHDARHSRTVPGRKQPFAPDPGEHQGWRGALCGQLCGLSRRRGLRQRTCRHGPESSPGQYRHVRAHAHGHRSVYRTPSPSMLAVNALTV